MMFEERRLHPIAIVFTLFKSIKEWIFFLILIFVSANMATFFIVLGILLIITLIYAILSWLRFTYYADEQALWLEYGVIKRTTRSIAKNRIQSIDFTESIIHRPFQLTKVQIETASGGPKAEAALSAVPITDAIQLREILTASHDSEVIEEEDEQVLSKKISFSRLFIAGITSGGVGAMIGFLVVALLELEEFIPESVYDFTYEWIISASLIVLLLFIIVLLLFTWMISVFWILLRYGNFTIKRTKDELLITRGLIERKQLTIPLHRIQAVGIEENLMRQPLGFVTVFAEIAGGSSQEQLADSTVLFPLIHRNEVKRFLEEFTPDYKWQSEGDHWIKPPLAGLPFYLVRSSLFILIAGSILAFIFPTFIWVVLVLFLLSLGLGWLCYHDAGFVKNKEQLLVRFRRFNRVTILLYPKRIQAFEKKQHVLERRKKLASMKLSIISNLGGSHYHVKNINEKDIDAFFTMRE